MLITDPFQPFDANKGYSITPYVLVLLSAPPELRWEHGLFTTLCLVPPAPGGGKVCAQPLLLRALLHAPTHAHA